MAAFRWQQSQTLEEVVYAFVPAVVLRGVLSTIRHPGL
jgi:hypothetical protein